LSISQQHTTLYGIAASPASYCDCYVTGMVRMIMEIVCNRSFTLTTGNSKSSSMGVRRKFSKEEKSRHFAYPFQVAEDAMQMDVHKTLYHRTQRNAPCCGISTPQKMPQLTATVPKLRFVMLLFHSCFFSHCIKPRGLLLSAVTVSLHYLPQMSAQCCQMVDT